MNWYKIANVTKCTNFMKTHRISKIITSYFLFGVKFRCSHVHIFAIYFASFSFEMFVHMSTFYGCVNHVVRVSLLHKA